jgi:hypothetical protein
VPDPAEFNRRLRLQVDEHVKQLMQVVMKRAPEQWGGIESRLGPIRESFFADDRSELKKMLNHYNSVYRRWEELQDKRKQEDWATTWDYVKLFTWRTAQGVMIAVIVLATAYVADKLEIPLPLLRL